MLNHPLALLLAGLLAAASLSACSTAEGFGKDLEAVGEAIQDDSQDVRD